MTENDYKMLSAKMSEYYRDEINYNEMREAWDEIMKMKYQEQGRKGNVKNVFRGNGVLWILDED